MLQNSAGSTRRRRRLSPVTFRVAAVVVAAALLGAALLSTRYRSAVGLRIDVGSRVAAAVDQGQLQLWWFGPDAFGDARDPTADGAKRLGFQLHQSWWNTFSLAWRPYHIAQYSFPKASPSHGVVLPLWPLIMGSLLLAGYSHGVVVGTRRATIGRCKRCGYDIRALPMGAACPECGEASGVGGQPPAVASIDARSDLNSLTKSGS